MPPEGTEVAPKGDSGWEKRAKGQACPVGCHTAWGVITHPGTKGL